MSIFKPVGTLAIVVLLLGAASGAFAHNPVAVNSAPSGPENAFPLQDIRVSQVAYHEVSAEAPAIWLRFSAEENQRIRFEAGVPRINRLINTRPAIALVGPGLPGDEAVPFALPPGMGVLVFDTDEQPLPEIFSEPFTGTESWIYDGFETRVPERGEYFLVGYLPRDGAGKVIVVAGVEERFTFADIIRLPKIAKEVRAFHEIRPFGGAILWMPIILIGAIITLILSLFLTNG